jgi:hypothetical protein
MPEPLQLLQTTNTRQFLLRTTWGLAPSLLLSVVCPLIIYVLLRPHFSTTSIIPLLVASLCPVFSNTAGLLKQRQLDAFGILVLLGIIVSVIGSLLGGNPQLLLVRESFVTGTVALVFLISLLAPKPLGYYFARQLLTGNNPRKKADFEALWAYPSFRHGIQGGTIFWSLLLLSEFALRLLLVFTLPIILVLAIAPIVFNIVIVGGIVVSIIWGKRIIQQVGELNR